MKPDRICFVLGLSASALAAASCEAVTSRDGLQCQTNGDCTARGSAFAATVCAEGLCQGITVPQATGTVGCTTSESCTFAVGGSARCVGGQCVSLSPTSQVTGQELCTTLGPVSDDDVVLFGVLSPAGATIDGSQAAGFANASETSTGATLLNTILATWNRAAVTASPPGPTFAAVACDETDLAASEALFDQVGVKFVIGPYADDKLKSYLSSGHEPLFSPLGDGAYLGSSASSGLHWSCSPSQTFTAPAFASAVDLVAKHISTVRKQSTIKLAVLQNGAEPDEVELATAAFSSSFTFNGESLTTANYLPLDVSSGVNAIATESTSSGTGISQASSVAIAKPDLVVFTGATWAPTLMDQIERRWSVLNSGLTPPTYLVMRTTPALAAFSQNGSTLPLTDRIFALDVSRDTEETSNYEALQLDVSELGIPEPDALSQYNDCLLTAMIGTSAAAVAGSVAPAALTSPQLATGVAQVTHEVTTTLGRIDLVIDPSVIAQGLALVNSKQNIELVGASAYLGLDPNTNAPSFSVPSPTSANDQGHSLSLQCPLTSGTTTGWQTAGVTYETSTLGVPSGAVLCPP